MTRAAAQTSRSAVIGSTAMARAFALHAPRLQSSSGKFFRESQTRNRIGFLLVGAALTLTTGISAQSPVQSSGWPPAPGHVTLPLWPGAAPGEPANLPAEADKTTAKDNLVAGRSVVRLGNVSVPTLTLYPAKSGNNGVAPAVVVFPGGGYSILAIDLEGTEVCDWLNSIGVTCVLLKYRVPDSGPYPGRLPRFKTRSAPSA